MAYLPFYHTPEEFDVLQEEKENHIRTGKNIHEWSCHNLEKSNRYDAVQFTILSLTPVAIMMGFVGYIGYTKINWFAAFCMFLVFCTFAYAWYLTAGLDNHYRYVLSELGIVKKHNRAEPAWVNKAMQVIAWGCAIGCIFAVAIAGPMALAGSGVLVLLAFGMMKRQPDNQVTTVIGERDDWLFAEYHLKRKVIVLWSRYDVCVHWNKSKEEVARDQTRGPLYLFFNTEDELKAAVEFLSSETKLACTVRANKKELFDQKRFPQELENLPVYGEIYTFDEAIERRKDPLARPEASYVIDGEWLSEKEWKETQKATISAMS